MAENNYSDYAVHVVPGLRRTKESAYATRRCYARLPCLRRKAFGAYHQNQSTNHIQVVSCEGKKLPKYYIFVVEHLYLHLVIYL